MRKALLKKIYHRGIFSLNNFTNDECEKLFRFSKSELYRIKDVLKLPNICRASYGESFSGKYIACI